ncbi:hypothetical protein M8J75_015635 [Diaphorina citri]|nr:hypothetical protein M8J75_015635 [Diaphorina citri]
MGSGGAGDFDQFKNTPEMNKLLKDPSGVNRRIFIGGIVPQDGQIDKFRSELERTFRKYGLIEAMIVKKRFSFVQFLNENSAAQAIRQENGKEFLGHKMDVKEAKAPEKKKEEPDEDDGNIPSYNIASSLAETLRNLPKEDLAPPPPQNDRSTPIGDHNFDSNIGGRGARGGRGGRGGFPPVVERGGRGGGGRGGGEPRGGLGYQGSPQNNSGARGGMSSPGGRGEWGRGRGEERGRGERGRGGEMRGRGEFRGRGVGEGRGGPRGGGRGAFNFSGAGNNFPGSDEYENDSPQFLGQFDSVGTNNDRGGLMGRGRGGRFDRGGRGGGPAPPGGDRWNQQEDRFGGPPPNDRWGADDHGPTPPNARVGGPPHPTPHVSNEDRTNDVEIIVCDRNLTEYAEFIEIKLKKIQLAVDLLFPKEDVPLDKVLGNISSRGTLYAIVVMHQHEQRRSMTLHILHGVPQEHRNIPVEDALELVQKNFQSYKKGDKNAPKTGPGGIEVSLKSGLPLENKHPDLMQDLLSRIADNQNLTALEYERVITYLQDRREKQYTTVAPNTQSYLQNRIMGLLNKPKPNNFSVVGTIPPAPNPGPKKEPLLQDPTVQRALQSLFHGNTNPLTNIGGRPGNFGR